MDAKYEYVDLVFENCNYVRIPPEYIIVMSMIEIRTHYMISCAGQFVEMKDCRDFEIQLNLKALDLKTDYINKFKGSDETFRKHLNYSDLTHVAIKLINNENEMYIAIPQKFSTEDGKNELQKVCFERNKITIKCSLDR